MENSYARLLKRKFIKKIREADKIFNCGQCGKYFPRAQYLNIHKGAHTGGKPLKFKDLDNVLVRGRLFADHIYKYSDGGKLF